MKIPALLLTLLLLPLLAPTVSADTLFCTTAPPNPHAEPAWTFACTEGRDVEGVAQTAVDLALCVVDAVLNKGVTHVTDCL